MNPNKNIISLVTLFCLVILSFTSLYMISRSTDSIYLSLDKICALTVVISLLTYWLISKLIIKNKEKKE
jgi:hypothetical protein